MIFSAPQAHYIKVGRVLTNNGFLTGGGYVVISGNCCGLLKGLVVWFRFEAVCIGTFIDGGRLGIIFLIKIKFCVYLVHRKKRIQLKFSGFSASIRFVYHIEYTKILLCLICYTVCFNVIPDKTNSLKVF